MQSKESIMDMIIKNPEEYAAYKEQNSEGIDLSEVDFSNTTLENIDFSSTELNGASFADCSISNCNFSNADLNATDFTHARVVECDFTEAVLNGTDFSYAEVSYCNFPDADMTGYILLETDLNNSDLSSSLNLAASRADETTIWPDEEFLPADFDTNYTKEDEEGEEPSYEQDY